MSILLRSTQWISMLADINVIERALDNVIEEYEEGDINLPDEMEQFKQCIEESKGNIRSFALMLMRFMIDFSSYITAVEKELEDKKAKED